MGKLSPMRRRQAGLAGVRPRRAAGPCGDAGSTLAEGPPASAPPARRSAPPGRPRPETAHLMVEAAVAATYGVPPAALHRASRGNARVAFARQVAMYVCHVRLGLTLTDIGAAFGRDRTTVAHGCRLVEERRDDPRVDAVVGCIETCVDSWRSIFADVEEAA